MKRIFARLVMAVSFVAIPPTISVAEEVITVGYFDLPPHGYIKNAQNVGAALKYFDMIAKEMGVTPHYVQKPLSRLLVSQDIDLILYVGKTPERAEHHTFSHYPLLTMQGTITVRRDSPLIEINSAADLTSMTIGIWQQGYLSPLLIDSRVKLDRMAGDDVVARNLQKIMLGRISGFYSPEYYSVYFEIKKLGLVSELRSVNLPEAPVELVPAFTKAGGEKYLEKFERAYSKVSGAISYVDFLKTHMD